MSHNNLVREIVEFDKLARKKVTAIKEEKERIGSMLSEYRIERQNILDKEVFKALEQKNKEFAKELAIKEEKAKVEYEARLAEIKANFDANKEKWVKEIFLTCVKE